MGDLEREERNIRAKEIAREALTKAGIDITAQVEAIINGLIEVTCILLPHGVKPAK